MSHYSGDYIYAWNELVPPILAEFKPKLVVVATGFDSFLGENLTTLRLSELFFAYAGSTLSFYPLEGILEGSYSVGLEKGLPAFIGGYLRGEIREVPVSPSYDILRTVARVKEIQGQLWGL